MSTPDCPKCASGPVEAVAVYRVGRKLGRTIYRNDELIGLMDSAEDAALVVAALNSQHPVSTSENAAPVPASNSGEVGA